MFRGSWFLWAVGALGVAAVPIAAATSLWASRASSPISASQPVVIELFTSEGCSSCPPADRVLAQLAESGLDGIPIIALSEHVDYWNRLGWKDPFSAARFTDRQQQYADVLRSDVYTPQMVVDGRRQLVGSDRASAVDEIRKAAAAQKLEVKAAAGRKGAEGRRGGGCHGGRPGVEHPPRREPGPPAGPRRGHALPESGRAARRA